LILELSNVLYFIFFSPKSKSFQSQKIFFLYVSVPTTCQSNKRFLNYTYLFWLIKAIKANNKSLNLRLSETNPQKLKLNKELWCNVENILYQLIYRLAADTTFWINLNIRHHNKVSDHFKLNQKLFSIYHFTLLSYCEFNESFLFCYLNFEKQALQSKNISSLSWKWS
jgi:hypothetical protein